MNSGSVVLSRLPVSLLALSTSLTLSTAMAQSSSQSSPPHRPEAQSVHPGTALAPRELPRPAEHHTPDAHAHGAATHHGNGQAPYAGMQQRDVKRFSADEADDLRAGRGMGYALSAELNGVPGPLHVLELAPALRLTGEQRREITAIQRRMQDDAQRLGRELLQAEQRVDDLFGSGSKPPRPSQLTAATAQAAAIEGQLRAVHLQAHLETADVLTPRQINEYNRRRGYR